MFGFLTSTIKAAAAVVDIPVSIVADTLTVGGALTNRKSTYTASAASRFVSNVKDMTDPN